MGGKSNCSTKTRYIEFGSTTLEHHVGYGHEDKRNFGDFPALAAICTGGPPGQIQTLPLGAQLIDMFGGGRFKFHARLVDATFPIEDAYSENKQLKVGGGKAVYGGGNDGVYEGG